MRVRLLWDCGYVVRWAVISLTAVAFGVTNVPRVGAQTPPSTNATAASTTSQDAAPDPLSEDELEVLVARIALYPDELVALISSASVYPLQVVEASRFLDNLKKDASLKPKDSWDGSVVSLLNYPDIVKMMADDLDWTQDFGDAIAYQQKDVLLAIQTLRDKAVADGIIKTDDKITVVQQNENVVIQPTDPEKIYVPRYEPEMLYAENYQPIPLSYYQDPYPNYWYPTATFFAGAVTGAIFASAVDWDNWGVWGGRFDGNDLDVDCNNCFNNRNFNGKVNFNDVDWKNVDRSKIKFDKNQLTKLDNTNIKNRIKADGANNIRDKAKLAKGTENIRQRAGSTAMKDIRANKIETLQRPGGGRPDAGAIRARADGARDAGALANRPAVKDRPGGRIDRDIGKPRPAAKLDNRPKRPSGLGEVRSGKAAQIQSHRGSQAMGGGMRGGSHREFQRGGGGGGHSINRGGGGGGRAVHRGGGGGGHRGGGGGHFRR